MITVKKLLSYDFVGEPGFKDAKFVPVFTVKENRKAKRDILRKKLKKVYGIQKITQK